MEGLVHVRQAADVVVARKVLHSWPGLAAVAALAEQGPSTLLPHAPHMDGRI